MLFILCWLRRPDSNRRPLGYEPNELPTAPLRDVKYCLFLNCDAKVRFFLITTKHFYSFLHRLFHMLRYKTKIQVFTLTKKVPKGLLFFSPDFERDIPQRKPPGCRPTNPMSSRALKIRHHPRSPSIKNLSTKKAVTLAAIRPVRSTRTKSLETSQGSLPFGVRLPSFRCVRRKEAVHASPL